jgi:hypothetical protein
MSTPNSNTPLFPTCAQALTVADVDLPPGSIYVGTGGAVSVMPADGPGPVTFVGMNAGQVVPVLVKGLRASGTTAQNLVFVR